MYCNPVFWNGSFSCRFVAYFPAVHWWECRHSEDDKKWEDKKMGFTFIILTHTIVSGHPGPQKLARW